MTHLSNTLSGCERPRVYPVQLESGSKAGARLIEARTFRAGERCRVKIGGRWHSGQVLAHPDGVRTSTPRRAEARSMS